MLQFCSLYSGSSGNSFLIKSDHTNILIDSGVSAKKIIDGLTSINLSITDIDAILITHEHIDHVRSLNTLSSKYNLPVYANIKTWDALKEKKDSISDSNKKIFKVSENFEIGDLKIFPFSTPHDAADPCGFNICNNKHKLSVATDLGHVSNSIFKHFEGSSSLMLEANYDPEILKVSSYPFSLKKRIDSLHGHLPNKVSGQTICKLINSGLKNALLVHLSKENNFPELVHKTIEEELLENNYSLDTIDINIASRETPGAFLNVI
ncbi:MAG: MBL fold metallo-hydrolase [Oscillospiraceae bacterium]|nr:MBL fold metallo-hydrolase [Oscillospiraceae bacterium]